MYVYIYVYIYIYIHIYIYTYIHNIPTYTYIKKNGVYIVYIMYRYIDTLYIYIKIYSIHIY